MKQAWMTWLLAGALAGSLHWNLRSAEAQPSQQPVVGQADLRAGLECRLAPESLDLTEEQARALANTCESSCESAEQSVTYAARRLADLRALLAQPEVDEQELRELVSEVSKLRARSLEACVESILEVRRVLAPKQVESMLSNCCRVEESDS